MVHHYNRALINAVADEAKVSFFWSKESHQSFTIVPVLAV